MIPGWLAYVAAGLIMWGAVEYIRDIYRGVVTPNLVTWFLWSLAPLIAFAAQLRAGAGAEAVLAAAVGVGPLAVFIAGLQRGTFKPQAFDWWCGAISLVALSLWLMTGSGVVGVGLSVLADAFGAAPTVRKSWKDPLSESARFFAFFAISALVTLMTLTEWTVVKAGFAVYILGLYVLLFTFVRFKPGLRKKSAI